MDIEYLKNEATRQFRHNNDNSPSLFAPRGGFVIAYDREVIDRGLATLRAENEALRAENAVVVRHLQIAAKWLHFWLDSNECDCADGHICGRPDRKRELMEMEAVIAKHQQEADRG